MPNPLVRKLQIVNVLNDEDRAAIKQLCRQPWHIERRRGLIMALLVPGDLCDLHVAILGEMDHSIATVTDCSMVDIPRAAILELTEKHPNVIRALWWATLVD